MSFPPMKRLFLGGILLIFFTVQTGAFLERAKKDTLKLVQVLFRHGDRAPTYTYPNDPYSDIPNYWPEGLSQLTKRGKMQQYELGKYLRRRYDGYLGMKYTQKELYVTSSDMDRTIMSLESNLAGLFPPVDPFNPKINWQPIPLRTIPWKEDRFLHNNVRCPKYQKLRREFYSSSDVVTRVNEENAEFIRYCAENSGLPARTVKQLYPLFDVLYAQHSHNFTLPDWAQGDVLPKLIKLQSIMNTWPTYTEEMKRLSGGNLLNLFVRNMGAVAGHLRSNPENAHSVTHGVNRKMLMYSAHDSTLSRIMNTMRVFEPHCPPYAAALLLELHQDTETREYFVEIHYRNDTSRPPYLLTPKDCGNPCKLQTFIEINSPLIPKDWDRECHQNGDKPFNTIVLKMHEHDGDNNEEEEVELVENNNLTYDWNPKNTTCLPTPIQLILMGLGLFAATSIVALFLVKIVQSHRTGDSILYNASDDKRPFFVGVLHNKPHFYGGRSTYEKL